MQHVFIVGSKGIPGAYGGFETFVDKLTEYHQNCLDLKYHVACKGVKPEVFEYHNARCFKIKVPNIGAAQAIYYDIAALKSCCNYIKKYRIESPIVYILACRIGPFAAYFQETIHKFNGKVYVNPDGHEWMRMKWSKITRKYWKVSEQLMIKHADCVICDSKIIQKYIQECYEKYKPTTTYIAYGVELRKSTLAENHESLLKWYMKRGLSKKSYYLVVGRFVPENNYEIMIREFMKSNTKRDLVLITNVSDTYLKILKKKTGFEQDTRIKFVGTVYNQELLMKIRENAYGYLHGHEVGGTNPSLLESLWCTDLNLLLDVGFNHECGSDCALYWGKDSGSLAQLINMADTMDEDEIFKLGKKSQQRIRDWYSWKYIANTYMNLFVGGKK